MVNILSGIYLGWLLPPNPFPPERCHQTSGNLDQLIESRHNFPFDVKELYNKYFIKVGHKHLISEQWMGHLGGFVRFPKWKEIL